MRAGFARRGAAAVVAALLAAYLLVASARAGRRAAPVTVGRRPGRALVVTWGASADRQGDRPPTAATGWSCAPASAGTRPADPALQRLRRPAGDLRQRVRRAAAAGRRAGPRQQPAADVRRAPLRHRRRPARRCSATRCPAGWPPGATWSSASTSPDAQGPTTGHGMAMQTSYATRATTPPRRRRPTGPTRSAPGSTWTPSRVRTPAATAAVVALGDSITDGWQSTTDREPALARLPRPAAAGRAGGHGQGRGQRGHLRQQGARRRRRRRPR